MLRMTFCAFRWVPPAAPVHGRSQRHTTEVSQLELASPKHRLVLVFRAVLGTFALWTMAAAAGAHDTSSPATIDQDVAVTIGDDRLAIDYTVELSRPAAFTEVLLMDADRDGRLSKAEQARYFAALEQSLREGLELHVNGSEVPLRLIGEVELAMPFRKRYHFEAPQPAGWEHGAVVELHNDNYLDWSGAVIMSVDPGPPADLLACSLPTPSEVAMSGLVPCQRDVAFGYRRGSGQSQTAGTGADSTVPGAPAGPRGARSGPARVGRRPAHCTAWTLASLSGLAAVWLLTRRRLALSAASLVFSGGLAAVAAGCAGHLPLPSDPEAGRVFLELHRGIYRAFEASTENDIYDRLAASLRGRVLDDVYSEVHEALLLREGGTVRFCVRRVKPIRTIILPADDCEEPSYRVRYRWRVYGTVTHFGHTHARVNEYEALYRVSHDGCDWRIADAELRQQRRVVVGQWKGAS